MNKQIILASQSPRRKALLERIGLDFKVEPSTFVEEKIADVSPGKLVEIMSLEKAKNVAKNHKDAIIIGSDTIVVLNGEIFGKPKTEKEAKEMLGKLSGNVHGVFTGYAVIDIAANETITGFVETKVKFRELLEEEIEAYVATGEPMDKAGAYGIQEKAAIFIESIEGDYSSVVGFPLIEVIKVLKKFGIDVTKIWNK